jgi:hypothetical protein
MFSGQKHPSIKAGIMVAIVIETYKISQTIMLLGNSIDWINEVFDSGEGCTEIYELREGWYTELDVAQIEQDRLIQMVDTNNYGIYDYAITQQGKTITLNGVDGE